jgi:hypothetical protein
VPWCIWGGSTLKLPPSSDPFLTINECCIRLGLFYRKHGKTVYRRTMVDNAIRDGRLRAHCIGRGKRKKKFIINPRDLEKFMESCVFKPERR